MLRALIALLLLAPAAAAGDSKSTAALVVISKDPTDQSAAAVPLTRTDASVARTILWKAHADAITRDRAAELAAGKLTDGKLEMPIFTRTFGDKPAGGRSLWISLHGGGGAPARVNDQQGADVRRRVGGRIHEALDPPRRPDGRPRPACAGDAQGEGAVRRAGEADDRDDAEDARRSR
jgi:hypothetical protein